MKKTIFNKEFLIGSATSGPQTESGFNLDGKTNSVWDHLHENKNELFFEGNNVRGNVRLDYKGYVDKAKELNFNSFRTSIQWTRLMPDGQNVSDSAVEFYRNYFEYIKASGMKVMINLFHFDTPMWLYKMGGFEIKESISFYEKYAKKAFELFGDIVDTWLTFNEPMVPVEMGYMNIYQLPGKIDVKKGMQVMHNTLMAHLYAVKAFKEMNLDSEIGIVLNITPVMSRSDSEEDIIAKQYAEDFFYGCYLEPILNGVYPEALTKHAEENGYMWDITPSEEELINEKIGIDILGLNYYQPRRVKTPEYMGNFKNDISLEGQLFDNYKYPKAVINKHRGWEIYPKGIYDMLKNIRVSYGNQKCYIAENGIGISNESQFRNEEGMIDDGYRIDFYKEHLTWIAKAIEEGSDCIGYHTWTFIDNWSWLNAYKNRYGVIEFDLENNKYKNKVSFKWMKDFAESKVFYE